jgi:hypothetical protein
MSDACAFCLIKRTDPTSSISDEVESEKQGKRQERTLSLIAGPAREANAPEIKDVNIGGNSSVTIGPFTTAGTFKLYCTVHVRHEPDRHRTVRG